MTLIHLRVHKNESYSFEEIVKFVTDYVVVKKSKKQEELVTKTGNKLAVLKLAVREQGEREHIHCVLECSKTLSTFRQYFILNFPLLLGNGSYSMAPVDKQDSMFKYLLKGTQEQMPDILYQGEYTDEQVKILHDEWWATSSKLSPKGKEIKITFLEECVIQVRKKYPARLFSYNGTDLSDIGAVLLRQLGKAYKILDVQIYRRMVLGILNSLNPSDLKMVLHAQAFPDVFGPTMEY